MRWVYSFEKVGLNFLRLQTNLFSTLMYLTILRRRVSVKLQMLLFNLSLPLQKVKALVMTFGEWQPIAIAFILKKQQSNLVFKYP